MKTHSTNQQFNFCLPNVLVIQTRQKKMYYWW